jgi:hypothetical protein
MLIRISRPTNATHKWVYSPARRGYTELGRNTYDMGLDGQSIKLLLVIKLRFGRVIGDEDNLFLCKGRTKGSGQAGQGGRQKEREDEYGHVLWSLDGATYSVRVKSG